MKKYFNNASLMLDAIMQILIIYIRFVDKGEVICSAS